MQGSKIQLNIAKSSTLQVLLCIIMLAKQSFQIFILTITIKLGVMSSHCQEHIQLKKSVTNKVISSYSMERIICKQYHLNSVDETAK
jgi:hypothetical protein